MFFNDFTMHRREFEAMLSNVFYKLLGSGDLNYTKINAY
jgi:hypothetical protein